MGLVRLVILAGLLICLTPGANGHATTAMRSRRGRYERERDWDDEVDERDAPNDERDDEEDNFKMDRFAEARDADEVDAELEDSDDDEKYTEGDEPDDDGEPDEGDSGDRAASFPKFRQKDDERSPSWQSKLGSSLESLKKKMAASKEGAASESQSASSSTPDISNKVDKLRASLAQALRSEDKPTSHQQHSAPVSSQSMSSNRAKKAQHTATAAKSSPVVVSSMSGSNMKSPDWTSPPETAGAPPFPSITTDKRQTKICTDPNDVNCPSVPLDSDYIATHVQRPYYVDSLAEPMPVASLGDQPKACIGHGCEPTLQSTEYVRLQKEYLTLKKQMEDENKWVNKVQTLIRHYASRVAGVKATITQQTAAAATKLHEIGLMETKHKAHVNALNKEKARAAIMNKVHSRMSMLNKLNRQYAGIGTRLKDLQTTKTQVVRGINALKNQLVSVSALEQSSSVSPRHEGSYIEKRPLV